MTWPINVDMTGVAMNFADPSVRQALSAFVLLQADVTANDASDRELMQRFGMFGPPAIAFFDHAGAERRSFRLVGFTRADRFREHVASMSKDYPTG
jgi:thiol:disulfide interchange protein DsbD